MLPLEVELTQFELRIWLEEEAIHGLAQCSESLIFCGCRHKTASAPKHRSGKARSWYARPSRRRDRLDPPCPRRHQLITGHYSQLSLSHPPSDPPIRTVQFLRAFFEIPFMRRTHTLVPRGGAIYCFLVLGNRRVNFVGPRKDTTLQVQYLAKACALQKFNRFGRALAAAAMRHNLSRTVEFAGAFGKITERNQVSAEIANLIFVRLAHVENVQIVAAVETGLQFARGDLRHR